MKVMLLALGLSAAGGVLLVTSCGSAPETGDPCSIEKASLGGCTSPVTRCQGDGDCPQPPDGRCGEGRCVDGKCEIDIRVGPITSQIYGDCQQIVCDWDGNIVSKQDNSDPYDDGRQCTVDFCNGGKPVNQPLPEGLLCPNSGDGVCHNGECVDCLDGAGNICKGEDVYCDFQWCVPFDQCTQMFCGGPCAPCYTGHICKSNADCLDGKCVSGKCQAPTCDDGSKNGDEEDVDCGGPTCGPCADGQACVWPSDCQSDVCIAGQCQAPTCLDGKKNGAETGPDCGGPCDPC